jgi:Na+(H+)/acetate symporter ActP
MTRKILGVIAGYAIFVVTSLAFFNLSGQNPHADPTRTFVKLTAIYGAFFSFIAGLVTQGIGRTKDLKINYVLAVIIAGFAIFSYFKTGGNHWTQTLAICVFAPVSILGGLFYIRRNKK